jgi:hypothetical protein
MAAIFSGGGTEDQLEAIKKREGRFWFAILGLSALLLASQLSNLRLTATIGEAVDKRQTLVIPGAAGGVYAPGLTQLNVANAARYVMGLGVNLTAANAKERLAELEKYCAADFLAKFQAEEARLLKEITAQTQSRALQADRGDTLAVDDKQNYTYTVTGPWEIKSGSLLMSAFRHRFTIRFSVGNPDRENPYGIQLHAFDVVPVDDASGRRGAAEAAPIGAGQG